MNTTDRPWHPAMGRPTADDPWSNRKRPRRVLAIGAHPDDIELGCAGALLAHRAAGDEVSMLVMSRGESGPCEGVSRVTEQEEAAEILGADLYWGDFVDTSIPGDRSAVALITEVLTRVDPDVVYTHTARDTHQDHRATAMATGAATRRARRILCYEAPSSIGFTPALYVDVAEHLETKIESLRAHMSQVLRNGLVDLDAVEAQARYRGFQARVRFAEGFEIERFLWDVAIPAAEMTHNNGQVVAIKEVI